MQPGLRSSAPWLPGTLLSEGWWALLLLPLGALREGWWALLPLPLGTAPTSTGHCFCFSLTRWGQVSPPVSCPPGGCWGLASCAQRAARRWALRVRPGRKKDRS